MFKIQNIFSINFNLLTMQELISIVDQAIKDNRKLNIVVVNVAVLVMCQKDKDFLNTINNADIVTVDGMPVMWSLKLLGYNIKEKLSGPDVFRALLLLASREKYSVYFFGAKINILEKMISNLKKLFPLLKISGYRDGYFNISEENKIIENINLSQVNMLFLGLPSPLKERFIENDDIKTNLSMGVGGVFDIEAGLVKRAPLWMQKNGLEWLFRLIQEPKRLWKRYFVTNTLFIGIVLMEILKTKLRRKNV